MGVLAGHWNHLDSMLRLVRQLDEAGHRVQEPRKQVRRARQLAVEKVDQLVESYLVGTPGHELAERFGVNETTVYAYLKRREVPRRPFRKLYGERLAKAIELYRSGKSLREVGATIGASANTVRRALISAGVEMRRP